MGCHIEFLIFLFIVINQAINIHTTILVIINYLIVFLLVIKWALFINVHFLIVSLILFGVGLLLLIF